MKTYVCHKKVRAFKIATIAPCPTATNGGAHLAGEGAAESVTVPSAFVEKHRPYVGGYFVRYADGYDSFSPAEAFESGYAEERPAINGDEPR